MEFWGWLGLGLLLGVAGTFAGRKLVQHRGSGGNSVVRLLRSHFRPISLGDIVIYERQFPYRIRADLQRAMNDLLGNDSGVRNLSGVRPSMGPGDIDLSGCITKSIFYKAITTPLQYEELDIGEDAPLRVLKNALWLVEKEGVRFAVLMAPREECGQTTGMRLQIGIPAGDAGSRIVDALFQRVEKAVRASSSYRGKILSLERERLPFSGQSSGIQVHRLRQVPRDQLVLPRRTLELLERNVVRFVEQRGRFSELKQPTRKGILFYGPPGTGKTHTIHHLAEELRGHTMLIVSAEQMGLLDEYMSLARLLQPSIVVLEDVDLIGRERSTLGGVCEEMVLNKLLNEMDGLKEEADILFILTTNRPEVLEPALASRPGRVDQAIEFPLPDAEGRAKLVRLYSQGISLSDECMSEIVRRTGGVSPAFIKELMRRTVQFHLESGGTGTVRREEVDAALDEILFHGGSLNVNLLGFSPATLAPSAPGDPG